jgi:hypothetical protein
VTWTDFFVAPTVELYYYEESSHTFQQEQEPSPYVDYVYWEPSYETYAWYQPTPQEPSAKFSGHNPVPVTWKDFYTEPEVQLYEYEPSTKTF